MKELYLPEGRKNGQPIVTVKPSVIDVLGEPTVNYDQLDELFRRELDINNDITPKIKLYGRRPTRRLGGHIAYTHSVHVNAVSAEHKKATTSSGGVMDVVLHEGSHLSDSVNNRLRTAAEIAARSTTTGGSLYLAHEISDVLPVPIDSLYTLTVGAAVTLAYQWYVDPAEKRAHRFVEQPNLRERYQDAIIFQPQKKHR
jgi:hypothetical protein